MATAKITIRPYIYVQANGEFYFAGATEGLGEITDKVNNDGSFSIAMPSFEHELEFPEDLRPACVALLRQHKEKVKAEHHMLMTRLQFQENQLLAIGAPDIVGDAPGIRVEGEVQDVEIKGNQCLRGEDDIPF
jgi:hypothetical protein